MHLTLKKRKENCVKDTTKREISWLRKDKELLIKNV